MKAFVLAAALILLVHPCFASIVVHDGTGIVGFEAGWVLDSNGHVWNLCGEGWLRAPEYDPPMPVDEILFWSWFYVVTLDQEAWLQQGGWHSIGYWPDAPAGISQPSTSPIRSLSVSPNPSSGPFTIAFRLPNDGPALVEVVDAGGRSVCRLLNGTGVAGDYSLTWSGQDGEGRQVPAGIYFAHATAGGKTSSKRLVLTR